MMWVIRGTNAQNGDDFAMVVEANSRAAAETWAVKRGIPVAFIGEAVEQEILTAKKSHQLWKYTPGSRYTVLGHPLAAGQLACLLLAGVMTMGLVYVRTSNVARSSRLVPAVLRG